MATISIETAKSYLSANLSCLPAAKERKHPTVGSWKIWSERLPTAVEVEAWFSNRHNAICIVTGHVSGNLECLDFDNKGELYEAKMLSRSLPPWARRGRGCSGRCHDEGRA